MLAVMLVDSIFSHCLWTSLPLEHSEKSTLKGCSKVTCCMRFTSKVYNVYADI